MPKVSIIVPIYNVADYLPKCLDSILAQTLKDIEIICVNDGSTDSSLEILEKYAKLDNRIKIVNQENAGVACARNAGLKAATGEYIGFVDSDDWIEKETYAVAAAFMDKYDVEMVSWPANVISEDFDNDSKRITGIQKYHDAKAVGLHNWDCSLYRKLTVTLWNKLYKNSIIKENDIWFPVGFVHEDNEFITKYLLHCKKIYFSGQYYYNYMQRQNSVMSSNVYEENTNSRLLLVDIFRNVYEYYKKYDALESYKELFNYILIDTLHYIKNIDKEKAIPKLKELAEIIDNDCLYHKDIELIRNNKFDQISFKDKAKKKKLFSIKNVGARKQITILGIKIKFRSSKLEQKRKLKKLEQKMETKFAKMDIKINSLKEYVDEYEVYNSAKN